MSRTPDGRTESRLSSDPETIRTWADEHDAVPVQYEDQPGQYAVVPESDLGPNQERVDWDEFFEHVGENEAVVIEHGETASEPLEVTHRDRAISRADMDDAEFEKRIVEGETVTTEVQETTVVENVVVEEATIESELVDTELVDQRVVDVELLDRECTMCDLRPESQGDDRAMFDDDHYLMTVETPATGGAGTADVEAERTEEGADVGESRPIEVTDEFPYSAEMDVREEWAVTREFEERFTVESRISETDVEETESVQDRDVDVEGLHRSIAESDLLNVRGSPEEVLGQCEVETEFTEDDRIHTHFSREREVEDVVLDRKRVRADVTGGESLEMEVTDTRDVGTEVSEPEVEGEPVTAVDEEMGHQTTEGETVEGTREVVLSEGEEGKTVVDASGEEIGTVAAVSEDGERMTVEVSQGITEKVKSALDWGEHEDTYTIGIDQVRHVYDDSIELERTENL